tara:strand:+ start:2244 stop:3839 length:1596 start_codon:yes stop_codon:yes gene_type:complete
MSIIYNKDITNNILIKSFDIDKHQGCQYNIPNNILKNIILQEKEGILVQNNALLVNTGKYTGRCPNERYIVDTGNSHNNINWGDINKPITESLFNKLYLLHYNYLKSIPKIYVYDGYVGLSEKSQRTIRIITELAWHNHFCSNMFIRCNTKHINPDITIICTSVEITNWKDYNLNSDTCIVLDINRGLQIITGTEYSGEIKKGAFSIMNYLLPINNILTMHCAANIGINKDTAIFFGLSGTGKTTLSADTNRFLIGDDEHGWDDEGIFNLEGGCYAKMINLDSEKEPLIYNAIKNNAILENVIVDDNGICDFKNTSITENTRCSYPLNNISNYYTSNTTANHPKNIIFLSCDAYGILPPICKLTYTQAIFYLISGYTAKIAGTEMGIKEPIATFSLCFGGAFMPLFPKYYAKLFEKKIKENNVNIYMVNTGWISGKYGIGHRIDIKSTRSIIDSILNNEFNDDNLFDIDSFFNLKIPKYVKNVDTNILNPRNNWNDKNEYDKEAILLKNMFINNWQQYNNDIYMKKLCELF